ncbi:MAG: UvrD-helicase domain-containing protein [Aeriscardovia sp.]|nr:UvrD-helicase domain-containing protein [Aeriscardovia sp.]
MKHLVIAGAGTGKTTLLLKEAVEHCESRNVLYLTYTDQNAREFEKAVTEQIGYQPHSITIMTWFSFLLVHGVRPFPARGFSHRIERMLFDQRRPRQIANVTRENENYYCPEPGVVCRSRLSDLAVLCDQEWEGEVIKRICGIYDLILVDEGQDFAGYDYDLLLALMKSCENMTIVGDPRQQTYRTNNGQINSRYPNVFEFFKQKSSFSLDLDSLSVSYRCSNDIICLANKLFPELPEVVATKESGDIPGGRVYKVKRSEFDTWVRSRNSTPTILRYDKRTNVPDGYQVMNMGDSKGLTLGDVAIIPTSDMRKWITGKQVNLSNGARAKLYVAITRASGDLIFLL